MSYSLAMLTDFYQLTMAQGYWRLGKHKQRAIFDLFFREAPFHGTYAIFCGLESVLNAIAKFSFQEADIAYLASLQTNNKKPLFDTKFLTSLVDLQLTVDIDAVIEGTLVFPKEPLLRVSGPIWECQLLESILLNLINFPTLIATKAARVCYAAKGDPVLEFGLRRAQGENGALTASRAAFIGGVCATSNLLAGQCYGIPVVGTHAHSWVMAFDNELEAFESYAEVMPSNCIFLVDTYNTLQGVKNAIQVARSLQEKGFNLLGIRLDSGDLVALSILARELLDAADLKNVQIVGSSDLDEYAIEDFKNKGAQISRWGVGTRLVTAYDQPALGGVYKLVAIQNAKNQWQYKTKITEDKGKKMLPGVYNVRRYSANGKFTHDVLYDSNILQKEHQPEEPYEELLIPICRKGKLIAQSPPLQAIRERALDQLQKLPEELKALKSSNRYPVVVEGDL